MGFGHLLLFGAALRFGFQQMAHEELFHFASTIRTAVGVPHARHHQKIEVLVRLDKRIHQPQCRFRRHIGVHFTDDQQQFSPQLGGVIDVRRGGVLRPDGIAHPLLVPRSLVHAIVMAAARRHRRLVEVAVKDDRPGRVLPARRGAVNSDAINVVIRVLRGGGLVPEDAIGEAGVGEVVPADIVKRLGTVRRAHAVHLHHDEAQVGQRGVAAEGAERLGHERSLRAGVNVLDHGILFLRDRSGVDGR